MTSKLMFVPDTHVVVPREPINNLLSYVHSKECLHEDTYRGGVIWTICRSCGRKWADDEGGFEEYTTPKAISDVEEALAVPQLTTPPVLRWDGDYLKVGNITIAIADEFRGDFEWSCQREEGTAKSLEEARRAAEKALGFPDGLVVDEL